ncbi:MAG: serine/threonine-protein kinase, partial [Hyphomonadaceae bacterium]|nr:serine/threonine-protein kinase [Hyphomonadaceae bacterium]
MNCPHCSAALPADARFCSECGRRTAEEVAAAASFSQVAAGPVQTIGGLQTIDGRPTKGSAMPAGPALAAGELFCGRYEIRSTIGAGGAGVVYAAHDRVTSEDVALKLIRPDRLQGSDAVTRLIREGVTARNVRHPSVIAVYDVGESDGQPFMSMELAKGQSLRSWNQRRLAARQDCSLKTAVGIISAILDGLEAAHAQGVVHRDLKPENVILTSEPSDTGAALKILDFGIAIVTGASSGVSGSGPAGSIGYMAPEQLTAPDTVGPSADLYSLSVIFYELLMDAPPQGHWQPPSGGRSGIPPGIDALIEKSLSNRSRSRPQSVAEYRKNLKAALGPGGMVDWKTLDPRQPRKGPRIPPWAAWTAGGLLALAFLGAVINEMSAGNWDNDRDNNRNNNLSGDWQDGYGSTWHMNVSNTGDITGNATNGPSLGSSFNGNLNGTQLTYRIGAQGYGIVAEG